MSAKFIRVYKPLDVVKVKEQLLIYGDLSGQCAHCDTMDLKLELVSCPNCRASFRYVAFRNVKHHLPKMMNIHETRHDLTIIDYDDYARVLGAKKAEDFFK